ncbi:uncharacterized protein LOC118736966 [Rhagoletis pomonella]|uniref:uncharacterized protein LOC118736966 n=1 Tax=Rhagoletis pomonella TaxID=28610 RepID=UPI0017835C5D|nr:uncharacterized protein LOC118736966 [Rhagoletis pomonella]
MVELKGAGSSTSKNLATEIIKILKKYDIDLRQIVSVTSDNGANMLKATKILSFVSEEESEEYEADCTNDEYLKKIELLEEIPDMLLGNIQVCRCAAHTAQLCALDVTKSSAITKYLLASRNLTKYVRKTTNGYRDIFELKQLKMPQLDCPTRWGSTFTMVENLKAAKDVLTKIESVKYKSQDENFEIDDSFWEFIGSYCLVFSPLQKAIKIFQEEQLHYDSNHPLIKTIGDMILQSFEKRTNTLMRNNSLMSCLYLDPRFHHTLTANQKMEATQYLKTIWDRINETNPNSSAHQTPNQFFDVEDELLNEYLSQGIEANVGTATDVHTKIKNLQLPILRSDSNVLIFWKEKQFTDPEMYALSNVCFAIPPTQVTIERAFSMLKLILTDSRNRLSEETLENILLVKLNPNFLEAAIDNVPLFQHPDEEQD